MVAWVLLSWGWYYRALPALLFSRSVTLNASDIRITLCTMNYFLTAANPPIRSEVRADDRRDVGEQNSLGMD